MDEFTKARLDALFQKVNGMALRTDELEQRITKAENDMRELEARVNGNQERPQAA